MKYHMEEHFSFRELQNLREQVNQNYNRKKRYLDDRKEKLFKS